MACANRASVCVGLDIGDGFTARQARTATAEYLRICRELTVNLKADHGFVFSHSHPSRSRRHERSQEASPQKTPPSLNADRSEDPKNLCRKERRSPGFQLGWPESYKGRSGTWSADRRPA